MVEPKNELQRNAITEARRIELETFQRAMDIQWLNSRMEDGRTGQCLALIKREAEMEREFQERTDHAAIVNARAAKEIALGVEVAKVRREEACNLLRRHYLREQDPTLRELTRKLQAGYVCRDLRQQILHNEHRRLQEKAEERQAHSVLVGSLYSDQEALAQEELRKVQNNTKYCKELQTQLVNRQVEKQCAYEDTLVEKKMLEEVMRTIADEDQRELAQKRMLTERTRAEMETFQRARRAWRERQKQLVLREERRVEHQGRTKVDWDEAVVAERARKLREKEETNQRIVAKILADEAKREERENIIKSLQEQEYLEKNAVDDALEREKLERIKRDTKEALTAQMDTRTKLAREHTAREADYRKQIEEKMAADDAREREKERLRKEKGLIYTQQLRSQIEDNAKRRAAEKARTEARDRNVFACDRAWREEVSEERKKIITEHAPLLIGYLQAGVLRAGDVPSVREGASSRADLAHLDVESMASASRQKRFSKCNAQCMVLREY